MANMQSNIQAHHLNVQLIEQDATIKMRCPRYVSQIGWTARQKSDEIKGKKIKGMHGEISHSRVSKGIGNKNVQNRTYTSAINITKIQVIKSIHGTVLSMPWHENNATSGIDTLAPKHINTIHVQSIAPARE